MGRKLAKVLTLSVMAFGSASYLTTPVPDLDSFVCYLFDNGSLRPASTLSLREISKSLAIRIGCRVEAVSLLHSSRIASEQLGGFTAQLLEPALTAFAERERNVAILLPLFFGPSAALTDYVPERLSHLQSKFPKLKVRQAEALVSEHDDSAELVAQAIADEVRAANVRMGFDRPVVILTDHGSPRQGVTEVRNRVGRSLAEQLGHGAQSVHVASMERRLGPEYAFNEPLLATALSEAVEGGATEIVVAQQFLQPGRHAGPEGDIAEICAIPLSRHPGLRIAATATIGQAPEILTLLERRFRAATRG